MKTCIETGLPINLQFLKLGLFAFKKHVQKF